MNLTFTCPMLVKNIEQCGHKIIVQIKDATDDTSKTEAMDTLVVQVLLHYHSTPGHLAINRHEAKIISVVYSTET